MVRLFLYFLANLAGATTVAAAISAATGYEFAAWLIGDVCFLIGSAMCIWGAKTAPMPSAGSVLGATVAFIAVGIVLAALGGSLYFSAPVIGHILVGAFSIGYYPPGPDVPFDMGAMFWALSMLGLCMASLAFGGLLKWLRPR